MSIYAISDLHLALSVDKPMDVFGARWSNYMERLESEWRQTVSDEDYVLVPGDISWATYLEQAYEDFKLIDLMPGRKIISKGNHDYWWTTLNKLEHFISENGFSTISFMHNNSFRLGNLVVCGTRGWKTPGDDDFSAEDRKIYSRELQRLEHSLAKAERREGETLIAAIHFPVFNSKGVFSEFLDIMLKYGVNLCIYGHLHGEACRSAIEGNVRGVEFRFVSADHLGFRPLRLI